MRRILLGAAFAMALPVGAAAQDIALVIANGNYDGLPDLRIGAAADEMTRAFGEAGFEVIEVRDQRFPAAAAALGDARRRLAGADRVAIVVAGHFANDGSASWLLARDARQPDDFTVGAQGVALAPIIGLAAAHPGAAAVLIADETGRIGAGPGLSPGVAPVSAPQGVAVFTGPMRGLLATVTGGLLVPGQSLGETADDAPSAVSASGFLSDAVAFRPADAGPTTVLPEALRAPPLAAAPGPEDLETELGLSREARRAVQRDLELLGYDPRGIDGIFGRGTRAAITRWQEDNEVRATGFLTGNQVALLQEQGARRSAELEAEAAARQAEQDRRDTAYWQEQGAGGRESGLRAYLERYPDGLYAARARRALEPFDEARREQAARADREAWDEARAEDRTAAYRRYVERFPEGAFRREADARIAELSREGATDEAIAAARAEEGRVAGNAIARLLIEQRLRQVGEDPGAIDGAFDEATRRAIRRFQRARDLPVTGYVNQATMARLLAP